VNAPRPPAASPPSWVRRAVLQFWGVGLGLWVLVLLIRELRTLLIVLLLSLFLSLALEPWVDRLERRGLRRGLGTLVSFSVLLVAAVGFVSAIGALLANQINDLVSQLPSRIQGTQVWLDERFNVQIDTDELVRQFQADGRATQWATALAGNLLEFGTTALAVLFQALTALLFTFYLTADGPRLRRAICSVLPPDRQREVLRVWELATDKTGAYLSSRLILALVSAGFHWVAFTVLGLPSAVALAMWVGVLSQFVPVIGTYLAGVLPLVLALGDRPVLALWVLGVIVVYQQIENYLLLPRITSATLAIHPAIAFGAVIVGASLLGAIGAILALPAAATVSAFVSAYVARHEVVESRMLRSDTADGTAVEPDPAGPAPEAGAVGEFPTPGVIGPGAV
jgi:predicted PurR-regulated permease PerM